MSFPKYPEYKDSGVEWIRDIPFHWEVTPVRSLAEESLLSFIDGDWIETPFITDEGVRLIQTGNIGVGDYKEQGFRFVSEETFRKLRCTEVKPGDVLICRLADPVGRACLAPDLKSRCITSVDVCILKTKKNISSSYVVYFFSSTPYLQFMEAVARGGTRQRVSRSFLGSVRLPLPSEHEQTQIARFLDHETAKIDTLIHEQKRLIELLKEKRQAVISHAVTKGLDPDVPMKDSGVEWLGEVPARWQISKLSHYTKLLTGFPFPSSSFSQNDSDVRLLRGANVGVSTLKWEDTVYWNLNNDDSLSRYQMSEGQIVIGMDRPWIGGGLRIARVTKTDIPCLLLQRVAAITATEFLDDNYLFNILQSGAFKAYVEPDLTGVSIPHLSPEQILGFKMPIPPIQEQILICNYINEHIERIDTLLDQASVSISLLKERRAALISAAVTGKIDVRNWEPPADESAFDEEFLHSDLEQVS